MLRTKIVTRNDFMIRQQKYSSSLNVKLYFHKRSQQFSPHFKNSSLLGLQGCISFPLLSMYYHLQPQSFKRTFSCSNTCCELVRKRPNIWYYSVKILVIPLLLHYQKALLNRCRWNFRRAFEQFHNFFGFALLVQTKKNVSKTSLKTSLLQL